MMLQELLTHAIDRQWFPPSYRGPLQSYVRKYAKALGHESEKCPPAVYHQPETAVAEKIFTASTDLHPRSAQVCVNALVKLFQRAVDEHCLPSLTPALQRRGSLRRERSLSPYIKGDPQAARCYASKYGLRAWPVDLAYETAMYLQWCTPAIQRGRLSTLRKGPATQTRVINTIGQVAGYAVNVRGLEPSTLTLEAICEPCLLEDFAWWWIQRRGMTTKTLIKNLGIMQTIVRHWYKEEARAVAIGEGIGRIYAEAPPQVVLDKEGRALSLEELDRLARSMHPLHDNSHQDRHRTKRLALHAIDPMAHPLPPSHRGIISSTNGTNSFAYMATWMETGLIIRLLIHRPLRIGNIANLEFRHLRPRADGGYDIVIPKAEIKNGKFMKDRQEWRERFPTRLLPLLKEWLDVWRPLLVSQDSKRDAEHPRKPRYLRMEAKRQHDREHYVFLNAWGLQYNRGKLSDSVKRMTVRHTMERPGGPVAWFPHNIRTTWTKEMIRAGLNPNVVRRILGDSFHVIDKHYGGYQDGRPSAFAVQLAREVDQDID